MSLTINCGFARTFIWQTKKLATDKIKRSSGETKASFDKRFNNERYKIGRAHV